MKKTTMLQKATILKRVALVSSVLLPGTGIATVCHGLSQIYQTCDIYWHPTRAEFLVSVFAPNGDLDATKGEKKEESTDGENKEE